MPSEPIKFHRSDRLILSSLLTSGKLQTKEEKAFRSMLESLDSGQLKLSPSQRLWAEQIYSKLRLDTKPEKPLVKSKTAKSQERLGTHELLDQMMANRPLKPPGKS